MRRGVAPRDHGANGDVASIVRVDAKRSKHLATAGRHVVDEAVLVETKTCDAPHVRMQVDTSDGDRYRSGVLEHHVSQHDVAVRKIGWTTAVDLRTDWL